MTTLDFILDESVIRQDKSADPAHAPAAALQETYLAMPTRLKVSGVDMLALPIRGRVFVAGTRGNTVVQEGKPTEDVWLRLPLLHVATVGVAALDDAIAAGGGTYSLPGVGSELTYAVEGPFVLVKSELNGRESRALSSELSNVYHRFAERVRMLIREHFPELLEHPSYAAWLSLPTPPKTR